MTSDALAHEVYERETIALAQALTEANDEIARLKLELDYEKACRRRLIPTQVLYERETKMLDGIATGLGDWRDCAMAWVHLAQWPDIDKDYIDAHLDVPKEALTSVDEDVWRMTRTSVTEGIDLIAVGERVGKRMAAYLDENRGRINEPRT